MKNLNSIFTFILTGILLSLSSLWAQDRGISYQAVARDANDALITQQNLVVRFTLLQGGSSVYQEEQTVSTNKFGLFNAVIGSEDFVSFNAIDWSPATSLQVEINPGTGFVDMGTTALESVPYSKSSQTAATATTAEKATNMSLSELTDVSAAAPANDQILTWDGSQWTPATPASVSPSPWSSSGSDIYYDQGNVGIGTSNPSVPLSIFADGTSSRKVVIDTDSVRSSNDLLEMRVPASAPDGAQFIEFQRGSTIEARINTDGSAEFQSIEFGDGTVQESAAQGPIAFGYINSNGTVSVSSGNITSTYNSASSRYEITITGESYFFNQYVTVVTPGGAAIVDDWRVSSGSGAMYVYLRNDSGSGIQGDFMFVTYKP